MPYKIWVGNQNVLVEFAGWADVDVARSFYCKVVREGLKESMGLITQADGNYRSQTTLTSGNAQLRVDVWISAPDVETAHYRVKRTCSWLLRNKIPWDYIRRKGMDVDMCYSIPEEYV